VEGVGKIAIKQLTRLLPQTGGKPDGPEVSFDTACLRSRSLTAVAHKPVCTDMKGSQSLREVTGSCARRFWRWMS